MSSKDDTTNSERFRGRGEHYPSGGGHSGEGSMPVSNERKRLFEPATAMDYSTGSQGTDSRGRRYSPKTPARPAWSWRKCEESGPSRSLPTRRRFPTRHPQPPLARSILTAQRLHDGDGWSTAASQCAIPATLDGPGNVEPSVETAEHACPWPVTCKLPCRQVVDRLAFLSRSFRQEAPEDSAKTSRKSQPSFARLLQGAYRALFRFQLRHQ